jgi:hypothetical protein
MKGIPKKALMTREDFELLQQMARDGKLRPQHVDRLRRQWQGLLNGRKVYVFDRELADGEEADGSEPDYRVLEREDEETGEIVRVQYKLTDDDTCRMVKLGYTSADVTAMIDELDGLEDTNG